MSDRELFTDSKEFLQLVARLRLVHPIFRRMAIDVAALWSNDEFIERLHRAKMCGAELDALSPEQFAERLRQVNREIRGTEKVQ